MTRYTLAHARHAASGPPDGSLEGNAAGREDDLRALRQGGDVPDARGLALPRVRLQDRLLRLVNAGSRVTRQSFRSDLPDEFPAHAAARRRAARADRRGARRRRREVRAAPPRTGQAAGARADRAADRSGLAVPRAVTARGL